MIPILEEENQRAAYDRVRNGEEYAIIGCSDALWNDETSAIQDQLRDMVGKRDDILFVTLNEMTFGTEDGRRYLTLPNGLRVFEDGNLPAWAILRCLSDHDFYLEQMGIKCFPSSETRYVFDHKARTYSLLSGIVPMPDCVYRTPYASPEKAASCFDELPCVVKSAVGNGGANVHLAHCKEDVKSSIEELEDPRDAIMQRACPSGDDLRVFVLGRRIYDAVVRKVADGEWKANSSYVPVREAVELTSEQEGYINSIMDLFPDEYGFVSVDFLYDENGELTLCETNINPGISALVNTDRDKGFMDDYIAVVEEHMRSQNGNS